MRKKTERETIELPSKIGSMNNNERIVFGKRVVSGEVPKEFIHSENKKIIAISLIVLFGISVTFGLLFSYQPPHSTSPAATPADTVYYGNEYTVSESGHDTFGLWLGTATTVWTFGYDTSVGQFVLNGNSFFSATETHAWYGSASIDGTTNTPTISELSSSTQYTISGSTGTIINNVVAQSNDMVGTYGYLLGQSSTEIFFVIPLDD
ncbi:MAG: hypothetical protein B2I17_06095 [Thermoplasmatales archaeon B_DKE]|nr:MAG: hypothetical protein B2I17_06095 [Thermoplasmatales archaeon B_DKE]QRF75742.1 hypothetical protein Thermo_01248 [Thermoplasmatales archaeon]